MAFMAPVLAWVGANAAGISAVASVVGAGASLMAASKKPKVSKASTEVPKAVPLPDENSSGVKLRLLETQKQIRNQQGYSSTLVSGVLGDSKPPPVAAPLVFGRTA